MSVTQEKPAIVHLSGYLICASAAEVEIVTRCLPTHIRLTRAEAGCVDFDVSVTDDPLIWRVVECFTDPLAFEFHQTRTRASEWWRETSAIRREFHVTGIP